MIKISNLNKFYNKGKSNQIHVINNTSLELPSKGLVSLLGQSGSGKTTLLNVIGGLDKARGVIEYDDVKIENYNMKKIDKYRQDNIGYIFQNYNLLHDETVYNNLAISLEMIGVTDKEEVQKRIEYTLKSVGMFKYRKKLAYALSGGQQQRVAIARALVKNAKVIIADEPTGNLDSENTIEVMNILKKISKNTLVLLVTHDINIANFYSDHIIELKDGQIVKSYENTMDNTLARNDANTLYLKDLDYKEDNISMGNVQLYSDIDTKEVKLDIQIFVRNGNIYIQADKPIKLLETSNLKLVNDHYRDLNTDSLENIEYDTSWFSHKEVKRKEKFSLFFQKVKNAFLSFKHTNKRGKALHWAFILMGMLLGASVICMINFATPDTTPFTYAENYYQLTSADHIFDQDPIINIMENFKQDKIKNISLYQKNTKLSLEHKVSFSKDIVISLDVMVAIYNEDVVDDIILGHAPTAQNEIVVDEMTAKNIAKNFGNRASIEEVLGKKVRLYNGNLFSSPIIVGICSNSQRTIYGSEEFYTNWCCPNTKIYFGNQRYYMYEVDHDGTPLYNIVDGRDVNKMDLFNPVYEVIIPSNSENVGNEKLEINGIYYNVVGLYEPKEGLFTYGPEEYITNSIPKMITSLYDNICANDDEILIIEGRKPNGLYECMVSVYMGRKIGDTYGGREIVGIYNGTVANLSSVMIIDRDSYIICNFSYEKICFQLNSNEFNLADREVMMSIYDSQARISLENQASNLKIFELLSFILMIISAVFIYFVMRSKMFSDIYSVGVYRSIGAKKRKIVGKTFLDLVILTTFTTLVGYLIILLLYNFTAESINDLLGERMFKLNNLYFILGMVGVYVMNLLFGILPINFLLRKTPSEICSKYDI